MYFVWRHPAPAGCPTSWVIGLTPIPILQARTLNLCACREEVAEAEGGLGGGVDDGAEGGDDLGGGLGADPHGGQVGGLNVVQALVQEDADVVDLGSGLDKDPRDLDR